MKLKILRNKINKTQLEVAKDLNIAKSTYFNYENGISEPDIDLIKKMATYFNVSIDYLLDYNSNKFDITNYNNTQIEIIKLIPKLNTMNTSKLYGYIYGLLANQ